MSTSQNIGQLQQTGEAIVTPVPIPEYTKRELIGMLAEMFESMPFERFNTIDRVEYTTGIQRKSLSTDGTVLEPVVRKLNELGLPTEPTYGSVQEQLGLSDGQLHYVVCSCHVGATMLGRYVASRLRSVQPAEPTRMQRIAASIRNWWNS